MTAALSTWPWRAGCVSACSLALAALVAPPLAAAAGRPDPTALPAGVHAALIDEIDDRAIVPDGSELTVQDIRLAPPVPDGSVLERLSLPAGEDALGPITVEARFTAPDGARVVRWVRARVTVQAPTVVLARTLERDAVVSAEDLRVVFRPWRPSSRLVTDLGGAVGLVATNQLREGRPLRLSQLRRPYVVRRAQRVAVRIVGQGFVLDTPGQALSNAGLGDAVQVRLDKARRIVRGHVRSSGVVEVQR